MCVCLMIVFMTISDKSDKLHIEKQEDFQHEVQGLFTFGATSNAKDEPHGSIGLSQASEQTFSSKSLTPSVEQLEGFIDLKTEKNAIRTVEGRKEGRTGRYHSFYFAR